MPDVAVASLMQESNTFAPGLSTLDDFTIHRGETAASYTEGTNSELAGAIETLERAGARPHPLLFAWAMPAAPLRHGDYLDLRTDLIEEIRRRPWDAVVLALHGAMATTEEPDADGATLAAVRAAIGPEIPLIACLDLHANVTTRMVEAATAVIGYHTDPHVDQAATGARAARLAMDALSDRSRPVTAIAKRPMIVPAESMNTTTGPLGDVRRRLDGDQRPGILDISLFPVQPWLDVPELGFGVLVTSDGDRSRAQAMADTVADDVFAARHHFTVELVTPPEAVQRAIDAKHRPQIVAHSADAPTAGAAGDHPAMVQALLDHGPDLRAIVPIVDQPAVHAAHLAGVGASLHIEVGATVDPRWADPVAVEAQVTHLGDGAYELTGASYTGMQVSMGRFAVLAVGSLSILATEWPAWSADPATFRHAGLEPLDADLVVVRSCSDFRPNFPTSDLAVTLDIPGPATPNLASLAFEHAPRPLWPLDML